MATPQSQSRNISGNVTIGVILGTTTRWSHPTRGLREKLELLIDNEEDNNFIIALVGNKIDLINESNKSKAIPQSEIREFVQRKNYLYIDVSAKTGQNISKLFEELIPNRISNDLFITENDILGDYIKNPKKNSNKKVLSDDLINLNDGFINIDTIKNSNKSNCSC